MSLPKVIYEDPTVIASEMVTQWEAATGKTLYPAQVERLMIDHIAYRESLVRAGVNDGARQGLVDFAREPMLGFHGAKVDTYRLPARPAKTTLRFSVPNPVASALPIPNLPRIEASTGVLFVPQREPVIQPGQTFVDIVSVAAEPGMQHNGLLPGSIIEPYDELPEDVTVTNITTSSGGADAEGTERFRQRIKLAQSRPGAGSTKQYIYLAMTADVSVIDVSVTVIAAGHVRLAVLTPQNDDPAEIVAAVDRAINQSDSKPTTDNADVVAASPVMVPITVTVTPRKESLVSAVESSSESALLAHSLFLARKLGYDVVGSEIESLVQNKGGIKRVLVEGADIPISPQQFAVMTWTVLLTEAEDD